MTYMAFLRGINVSGQKIIKMVELKKIFESFGLKNVRTYIQSGNVVFESSVKDIKKLRAKIENGLLKELKYAVTVILRTKEDIEKIVKLDPFKKYLAKDIIKPPYVVFLADELKEKIKLPPCSEKDGVEIIGFNKNDLFCLSHPLKNGSWGFPNLFVEKNFKVPATTRNWNTINKILNV